MQLGHSIQSIYGEIDVDNYLRRFIQFPFPLPQTTPANYLAALWRDGKFGSIINSYANRLNVCVTADYGNSLEFAVLAIFKTLVTNANLTLRQIEDALFRYYRMGLTYQPPHLSDFALLAVISVLKVMDDPDGILSSYLSGKDANAVYRLFFGDPLSRPPERYDMIEPQRVMQKIIEFGMARRPEDFHLDSSDFAQWPSYNANENFHLGKVLSSMLLRDLTNTKIAMQSNFAFARTRAQALFDKTEFHFEPDPGWYTNGMIFT